MKTKRIYLLRHGETDYNKNGMVQGRGVNASLNEKGRSQALKVFEALNGISFDQLYASTLVRTHETLAPFSSEFIQMEGLDEISWGDHEGAKTTPASENMYMATVNDWRNGKLDVNVGGGESPLDVVNRQKPALDSIINGDAENILICMHGRAMRILLCLMLNYPLRFMDGFPHQNCSYYSLMYNGNTFYVDQYNETSHLNG